MFLFLFVSIWWISNAITSIASKNEMTSDVQSMRSRNKTPSLTDMRSVILTTLQFLVGSVVSVVWIKLVKGHSIYHLTNTNKKYLLVVVLGNLIGHLSVNASYILVASSATQIIKSSEPIFMFLLLIGFSYKQRKTQLDIDFPVLCSIVLMFLGMCLFVMGDITFNIWGVVAAVLSNIAFALRNIVLKKLNHCFSSPMEQYLVLSVYGSFVLVPVTFVKLVVSGGISLNNPKSSLVAAIFHCIYNIASIAVLRTISPMNHSILNFTKRVFVIMANINYFNIILTWQMSFGFVILVIGLMLYHFKEKDLVRKICKAPGTMKKRLSLVSIVCFLLATTILVYVKYCPFPTPKPLATSWVYQRPIPRAIVENIKAMHYHSSKAPLHVYCGTSQCMRAIQQLNNPSITTNFLVIPDLVRNTSLEEWVKRHALNKILSGIHFEDHLQEAVRLAHHWQYGGEFFDPTVKINSFKFPREKKEWLTIFSTSPANTKSVVFQITSFPPRHPFIKKLFDFYGREYQHRSQEHAVDSFRQMVWNVYEEFCNINSSCPTLIPVQLVNIQESYNTRSKNRFGTLSYDTRVRNTGSYANLGDEIQGFPGVQFLPYVDFFLGREQQTVDNRHDNFTIFFNAWWGDKNMRWPPPPNIHPIMLSMHLDQEIESILSKNVDFLKLTAPIGGRDKPTVDLLRKLSVDSFFSGCLTVLLQSMNSGHERRENIYIVDVEKPFKRLLPTSIRKQAISLTHAMFGKARNLTMERFTEAYKLIEKYSRAKLVITQRIHCALPCVAMGIPVIFINSPSLPGGGGSRTSASSRVVGLTNLFHTLDLYDMSMRSAKRWLHGFNWKEPPRNPNVGALMKMRATSWNVIKQNRVFYEAAHKFGMIPLTSPWLIGHSQLLFHLVFSPSKHTVTSDDLTGGFTWRHWRCVESVFCHHPSSKVIIHSNSLHQSTFDVLTEVGYDLEVRRYDLAALAQNTPVETVVKEGMKTAFADKYWYGHETTLIPLLLLYKFGGVYLDTDTIVVRPLDTLKANILGLTTDERVMKFEKEHPLLELCLELFQKNFDDKMRHWGKSLLLANMQVLWQNGTDKNGVETVSRDVFYAFDDDKMQQECFYLTSGAIFDAQMKIIKNLAYVVYLSSEYSGGSGTRMERLVDGTICKHLLNSYCVLCNQVY